ncbi:MAG: hypothetical protein WC369_01910 [Dehalococcoidales bacterium]|jgi:hypothetical protein
MKVTRNSLKDLIVIAVILAIVSVLSYYFNLFAFLVELFEQNPKAITFIDEIITGLVTLSVCFAVFSWRRWVELRKETAERIRLEEELIEIATTNAEVERIINKQLRCEVELRRNKHK